MVLRRRFLFPSLFFLGEGVGDVGLCLQEHMGAGEEGDLCMAGVRVVLTWDREREDRCRSLAAWICHLHLNDLWPEEPLHASVCLSEKWGE